MKHVIIGTAGHVDHGKTLLVKALTGIDTDRLQEEKARGITIDLGFAHLDFADGAQAGLVDVPGHERFIGNMLAGAGGIDLAMLVVAADEGFMPQTVEHLDILGLLGIREGLVVITKTDLVEPPWMELILEDVQARVKGTFLEDKPIVTVSAYTGQGIAELRQLLHSLTKTLAEKDLRLPFRLPVDRVFSVDGFGTVVTGTLIEGRIHKNEAAQLLPSGVSAKVRGIQVHGRETDCACAGQRVAVNLAGLKKCDVRRGDTLACPGTVNTSRMLDVCLQSLKNSRRTILTQSRVHLYHGASVMLAKLVLLDRESLLPGESCYAQLHLDQPLAAKPGDRFILRFYSPLETIGGGIILDETPVRHRAGDAAVLKALAIRESGSDQEKLLQTIAAFSLALPGEERLQARLGLAAHVLHRQLAALVAAGEVLELLPGRYLAASELDTVWGKGRKLLEAYHAANPLHAGMKLAELRQKAFPGVPLAVADALLTRLVAEGHIKQVSGCYAMPDFSVQLGKHQAAIRDRLLELYYRAGLEPPDVEEVYLQFRPKEQADCRQVMESLISGGQLVRLSDQLCYHPQAYARVLKQTREFFAKEPTLTLAQFRDMLGTSRKYALAVLEFCDRNKLTHKEGDVRRRGVMLTDQPLGDDGENTTQDR